MFSATLLKRPRTPPSTTPTVDYQSADSEHLMKRARPGVQPVDEVKTVSIMIHLSFLTSSEFTMIKLTRTFIWKDIRQFSEIHFACGLVSVIL